MRPRRLEPAESTIDLPLTLRAGTAGEVRQFCVLFLATHHRHRLDVSKEPNQSARQGNENGFLRAGGSRSVHGLERRCRASPGEPGARTGKNPWSKIYNPETAFIAYGRGRLNGVRPSCQMILTPSAGRLYLVARSSLSVPTIPQGSWTPGGCRTEEITV